MGKLIAIADMSSGQKGRIVQIDGGYGMIHKLDTMGIRVGNEVQKVTGQLMRGPIMLRQGNTRIALGFGMAQRIWVEIKSKNGDW